ncbi:hypothetical protein [Candidatus Albibeggiatoa sp. nov. NOAA]|uniref:hypothetical protein n=1 Tax=Candidatus Albibeggiatoa sp. nov. NOAA TaxID=3162724 RepID=UPI0032F33DB4|nr:hypothetical protein [Thiotrichaceae bacterium]
MNNKLVLIILGVLIVGLLGFFIWNSAQEQVEPCTYAVFVSDKQHNRALSDVEVTYTYKNQLLTGYSDSEGYYLSYNHSM